MEKKNPASCGESVGDVDPMHRSWDVSQCSHCRIECGSFSINLNQNYYMVKHTLPGDTCGEAKSVHDEDDHVDMFL